MRKGASQSNTPSGDCPAAGEHPYQDPALGVDARVDDLLRRMDLKAKVGLMFHQMVSAGALSEGSPDFGIPSAETMVRDRKLTHFNILGAPPGPREFAAWSNAIQRLALNQPLGIPVSLSTDPRHSFTDNPGTAMRAGPFSQWPEPLGLAAIGDPNRVERFADVARQEYLAVGIRVALHPQADLATEPRWSRVAGTFGEDAALASDLVAAYIRGFQGEKIGPDSVSTVVKHFPGGGPQKDGEDPHFATGREQVYPGGGFGYHLKPFQAALAAGARQMMPYYGMPVGTEYEEVGFGFNKAVISGILRQRLGFDGIVCTDWGLLTDASIMGTPFPARAWGVEALDRERRMLKALDAGIDQFGGEICTDVMLDLVAEGRLSEARIDDSARRLLREKFLLGLFDAPFVDEDHAAQVVGGETFRAEGRAAQSDSLVLLTNKASVGGIDGPTLPLGRGLRIYCEGVAAQKLAGFATVVDSPADAEVALLRVRAPFDDRGEGFEGYFHSGSLEFPPDELARLLRTCRDVPTILDIYLDRPAVLGGLESEAAALTANFGASDEALLDVIFGMRAPLGSLPFDLPRSMAAVRSSRSDVPFDTEDPVFRFGHGLRFSGPAA